MLDGGAGVGGDAGEGIGELGPLDVLGGLDVGQSGAAGEGGELDDGKEVRFAGLVAAAGQFAGGDLVVLDGAGLGLAGGAEVVAGVAVPLDAGAGAGLGRQGGPADVVAALTPGDPCGCPFATGDPKPAVATEIDPAAVVVGGPAKGFIRLPGPAEGGPAPAAIDVGPPRSGAGEPGLEAEAVSADIDPAAMRA